MIGNKQEVVDWINNKDTGVFEITKKTEKGLRSRLQVRYYWGVVVNIISDFHGLNPIEVNEMLKTLFKRDTFTNLDKKEFKEIIEIVILLWKEKYEVVIPLPSELEELRSLEASFF